jgi:4a-hydroxytetrahydrobiopterin dehydratase
LLIKELNLLARAVIIVDSNDIVRYIQIGKDLAKQLDYVDALKHLNEIIKTKPLFGNKDLPIKCWPCEAGILPMPIETIKNRLRSFPDWQLVENKKIVKEIKFVDFVTAKYFLDLLAVIAQEQGHHPNFTLIYNKLKITLTTHAANGLTENDFIMAQMINELGE